MASGPFPARYHGRCAECGEYFREGTQVRYNDDDQIVHADSWVDPDAGCADEEPCSDCHLVHTGECW
jgi:hypothetical protein